MEEKKTLQSLSLRKGLLVGLTLFSMFFGAGNLILAPEIGYNAQASVVIAMLGFLITAVGLPVLSIVSVARAGSFTALTDRITPKLSIVYATIVYLSVGPFLALPRTASTAAEMVLPIFGLQDALTGTVVFSILFFTAAFLLAMKPNKLTEVIGRVSGPALVLLIVVLIGAVVIAPPAYSFDHVGDAYRHAPFMSGFIKGYLTMDVFASLTYGVTICMNIKALGLADNRSVSNQLLKSGLVAGALLLIIYVGFSYIGLAVSGIGGGAQLNGARIISLACEHEFLLYGLVVSAAIFLIACLNVAISLISSISVFFSTNFPRLSYIQWALLFTVVSALISNVGLTAILTYSVPVLCAIYPVGIVLVVMGLMQKTGTEHAQAWRYAVAVCIAVSVVYAARDGFAPGTLAFLDAMPLSGVQMPWLIPTVFAWACGEMVYKIKKA